MKLNWGYRVAILYISFAGLIIFLVTKSMNEKVDLVATDYYAQELKFQGKMESIDRNNKLANPAMIYSNADGIRIEYPTDFDGGSLTGSVMVFRPSDKSLDFIVDVMPGMENIQIIPFDKLILGMYRVKVEYEYEGINYYTEKQVVIR